MPVTRADAASKADNAFFEESLASKPFVFVIGENRKEFHVHKELIGQLSPALNALVNGQMKEAREGRVEWLDLDTDTFVRFAKYAYSRDYTEAEPEILTPPIPEIDGRSATEQQVSQGSERQTIDLTDQQDEESSSDIEDDEEGSTSMSDDDDDEDDDEDDESENNYETNQLEYSSEGTGISSDVSSTLSDSQANRGFNELPYSIKYYMDRLDTSRNAMLAASNQPVLSGGEIHTLKRRRLVDATEYRSVPDIHDKYEAMKHFREFDIPRIAAPTAYAVTAEARWRPRPNVDPYESYRPVFLSHARLYVLADKYGVEDLRALTLQRLHRALVHFTIFPERVPDLIALIHAIYDNTVEEDVARKVVAAFFSCVGEDVKGCEEFRAALRCEGDFADDLFQQITRRLR